jgi:hypothetical protein
MDSDLGYTFYPRRYAHSPGYPKLEVHLYGTPTLQHFDPHRLSISVVRSGPLKASSPIEQLIVDHPWTSRDQFRVCAGALKVIDRAGKTVIVFTYGGTLDIHCSEAYTTCTLSSSAPILETGNEEAVPTILAEESEIILAERHAACGKDQVFEKRLAEVDPFDLYTACLDLLRANLEASHHKELPHNVLFLSFLHREIEALRDLGEWPVAVPDVNEIL